MNNNEKSKPSFLIVGAGAVGCYYGSRLIQAGCDVTFLSRGKRYEYLSQNPLTIKSYQGDYEVSGKFVETVEGLSPDIVILATKSNDLKTACEQIKGIVSDKTSIISFLNGIESENVISSILPETDVIGGIAFIGSELDEKFILQHTAAGHILIGNIEGVSKPEKRRFPLEEIKAILKTVNVRAKLSDDIHREFWNKMLWNTGFNALCAITGRSAQALLKFPETRELVFNLMKECSEVAIASGYQVTEEEIKQNIELTEQQPRDVIPSMLQDHRAGKHMEIEEINGKVVDIGHDLGIPVPCNENVTAIISIWNAQVDVDFARL